MIISSYNIKKLNNKLDSLIEILNGGPGSGNFNPGQGRGVGKPADSIDVSKYSTYEDFEQDMFRGENRKENIEKLKEQGINSKDKMYLYFVNEKFKKQKITQMSLDEAKDTILENIPKSVAEGWFIKADSSYKKKIVQLIVENDNLRSASLSLAYETYKELVNKNIGFNDFLNKELDLYRGDSEGKKFIEADSTSFISYTPFEDMAKKFGKVITKKTIKPKETLGVLRQVGEFEFLVPTFNQKKDVHKSKNASVRMNDLLQKMDKILNGGKGSGNFKHGGRPGKVGGSSSNNWSHNPSEKDLQNEFDKIEGYCLPVETAEKISELKEVNTYSKIKKFLSDRGIAVDTDVEELKGKYKDEVIDSPSNTFVRLAIGIEAYRDKFGKDALKSLKKVKFYDNEESAKAAYYYSELGEKEPKEGQISFRQWDNTGREIFHELAHAYQDSHKREGEDAVTYSNRVVKEAKLSDKATAYTGAGASGNGKGMEAERFADSFARGFSYGNKEDLDFIDRVANLDNKKKNFIEEPLTIKVNQLIYKINETKGKRGNPYHGKDGKFTSGPSSSSGDTKSMIIEKGGIKGYLEGKLSELDDDQLSELAKNPIANLSEKRLKEVAFMRRKMYDTEEEFYLANQWLTDIVGNGDEIMGKAKQLNFDPSKEIELSKKLIGDKEVRLFRNQEGEFDKENYNESRWGDIPHSHSSRGNDFTIMGNKKNILIHPEVLYSADISDSYYRNEREYVIDNKKVDEVWRGIKLK